jgi:hypothetical protein
MDASPDAVLLESDCIDWAMDVCPAACSLDAFATAEAWVCADWVIAAACAAPEVDGRP